MYEESESSETTQTETDNLRDPETSATSPVLPVIQLEFVAAPEVDNECNRIKINKTVAFTESQDCNADKDSSGTRTSIEAIPAEVNIYESAEQEAEIFTDTVLPEILYSDEYERKNWEESLFEITNEIGIKYTNIFSIFIERLNGLQTEYKNNAIKTGNDFNWKELNIVYVEDLNILTLPTPIIECLNHYLPIHESLYIALTSIYIYNILAVKAWNEGFWLSHYNGYEINFINKENVVRKTLMENFTTCDKKLRFYCFTMKNNFVKFCLENSFQELLACEEKIFEVSNVFKNLMNDDKFFSDKICGTTDTFKKNVRRKINVYFELSQRRALDAANYKCQPIILQFLKITNRAQAIHIPRYGHLGFNIRASNQKPTMWSSNLVIKQQQSVSAFTGFSNGNQSGEHKIAQDTQLTRLATNTPPVYFEADKPHFFNSNESSTPSDTVNTIKKSKLDPFVIKSLICLPDTPVPEAAKPDDVSNKLKTLLKSKNQSKDQIKINTLSKPTLENDTVSTPLSDNRRHEQSTSSYSVNSNTNNINTNSATVKDMTSHKLNTNDSDLFSPKAWRYCHIHQKDPPKGSTTIKRCALKDACEHLLKCRFGHTIPEIEKFTLKLENKNKTKSCSNSIKSITEYPKMDEIKTASALLVPTSLKRDETKKPMITRKMNTVASNMNTTPVKVTNISTTKESENKLEKICTTLEKLLDTQHNIQLAAAATSRHIDRKRQRTPSPPLGYPRRPESQWITSSASSGHKYSNERQTIAHHNTPTSSTYQDNFRIRQAITPASYKTSRESHSNNVNAQVKHRVCNGKNTNLLFPIVTTSFTVQQADSVDTAKPSPSAADGSDGEEPSSTKKPKKRCRLREATIPLSLPLEPSGMPADAIKNKGVNIYSSATINTDEMLVLTLGLKFVVADRPGPNNDVELLKSLDNFCRKIRIKKYFLLNYDNSNLSPSYKQILHQKVKKVNNTFDPPPAGIFLEHYINRLKCKARKLLEKTKEVDTNVNYNISDKIKRIALKLHVRKDIMIKNADKNLGVTVMDRSFYFEEALSQRHLGNRDTYKQILSLPSNELLIESLTSILKRYNQYESCCGKISEFANDLLMNLVNNKTVCPSHMYFIPKIHKTPMALRPICSSINSSTYNASKYLDILLQPIMKNINSFICNSAEIVYKLETMKFPAGCQLLEADVENLYPSINIEDGLRSLRLALVQHNWNETEIEFVIELARWVLTNNYIQFGDRFYLQLIGTAMGTPFAVTFACIHLAIIEAEAFEVIKKYGFDNPLLFFRFIDDIIAVFNTAEDGHAFMAVLNSRRIGIQCPKYIISAHSATFLDVTIFKGNRFNYCGRLDVKLHQKPINKFLFLPPSSYHPKKCMSGWISCYIKRIRLNCSDDVDFLNFKAKFFNHLRDRGHNASTIIELFQVDYKRAELLMEANASKIKNKNKIRSGYPVANPIAVVLQHNPRSAILKNEIKRILKPSLFTKNDSDCKLIFGERLSPICAWTNGTSLLKIITRSKLKPDDIPIAYKFKKELGVLPSNH